jgi:hypothetical protein
MPTSLRKRPCRLCRRWFLPDPRLKDRQRVCSAEECQRKRQASNQTAWLAKHPGYFRGRGADHRAWRREHPDAQRRWREEHPESVARDREARKRRRRTAPTCRAVEQEAMALQLLAGAGDVARHPGADEQEAMPALHLVLLGLATGLAPAGEQEPIAGSLTNWHARGKHVTRRRHAQARY